jgi:Bacteriophage Mu Gam like protein
LTPHLSPNASAWSASDADEALRQLLQATLEQESRTAARDAEISAVQVRYGADLAAIAGRIASHEKNLEAYYTANQKSIEADGKKSLQLGYGLIGMRAPSNPALVPLNDKWTWEAIEKKLKALFKLKFFHKPKPPAPDKVKIKREMTAAQMQKCGLKLDSSETFFVDLNRLAVASEVRKAA